MATPRVIKLGDYQTSTSSLLTTASTLMIRILGDHVDEVYKDLTPIESIASLTEVSAMLEIIRKRKNSCGQRICSISGSPAP